MLEALSRQNAWTLLGYLFLAIGKFGKPRSVRTDNAGVFRSQVFRLGCRLAGIRQQFTVPGCPWMNGRIERLFGTLKNKLDCIKVNGRETLKGLLAEFQFFYNCVRPHQNLGGLTPNEAWYGINPYAHEPKSVQWFEAWGGLQRILFAMLNSSAEVLNQVSLSTVNSVCRGQVRPENGKSRT